MPDEIEQIDFSVPYTFEFYGGPSDGCTLRSDATGKAEREEAEGYVYLTGGGQVGKAFKGKPPGQPAEEFFAKIRAIEKNPDAPGLLAHKYRVKSREEADGQVVIGCEYEGVAT